MTVNKTAIVLSGGKNSRMNYKTKAFLKLGKKTFIEKILEELNNFEEKIISCNNFEEYKELNDDVKLIQDIYKDKGPIGGIYSSLMAAKCESCLIVAADMPFIDKNLINMLSQQKFFGEALIPVVNGKIEPLCGIYKKSCIKTIEMMIKEENYKLMNLLKRISVTYLPVDNEKSFLNINTPEQYREVLREEDRKPIIVNIMGSCSNVGKTTVIEGIIKELKTRGYSVATIKHDVHGFDIDKEGKDTWRHRKAGAETVFISSKNRMAMIREVEEEVALDSIIDMASSSDIIIIEGYKKSAYKKIEVFRSEVSTDIITSREYLLAIASDVSHDIDGVPVININDYKGLADIIEKIKHEG